MSVLLSISVCVSIWGLCGFVVCHADIITLRVQPSAGCVKPHWENYFVWLLEYLNASVIVILSCMTLTPPTFINNLEYS